MEAASLISIIGFKVCVCVCDGLSLETYTHQTRSSLSYYNYECVSASMDNKITNNGIRLPTLDISENQRLDTCHTGNILRLHFTFHNLQFFFLLYLFVVAFVNFV